jgi:hypothetical protein
MTTACNRIIVLCLFAGSLSVLYAAGCARQPPQETYGRRSGDVAEVTESRRFIVRGENQRYYVDSRGGLHLIAREVPQPSGIGGELYYIEGDERPYYLDESQRLYYRDSSGRVYYIEDVNPGKVNEPEVIIHESRPSMIVSPSESRESCASQWESCMSGCQGISRRQSYTRPECIRDCEIIRNNCRDQ